MELKLTEFYEDKIKYAGFNRTFMELKYMKEKHSTLNEMF